jgi:dimethylhistidine N-methyltransferase
MALHSIPAVRPAASPIADDVLRGLAAYPKSLPPKLFYDARGSELFEQITRLPEYYLTRAERSIFERSASEIVAAAGRGLTIIELGAGTAEKTTVLLRAALARQLSLRYVPVDVSASALEIAAGRLRRELPRLKVEPLVADYTTGVDELADIGGRKLVLYIGSSIGNFEPDEATRILRTLRGSLRAGDALLLGTDLPKKARVLRAAYNDAQGVTAEFNLNVLARINRELSGDFNLRRFRHEAVWNPQASRVEMYLVSLAKQQVTIDEIGLTVPFAEGERIHTENSYKFAPETTEQMLAHAGFAAERMWTDAQRYLAVHIARVK